MIIFIDYVAVLIPRSNSLYFCVIHNELSVRKPSVVYRNWEKSMLLQKGVHVMVMHKRTRLVPLQREEIYRRYKEDNIRVIDLSREYHVSRPTIYKILE